jgi:hypothetical protein
MKNYNNISKTFRTFNHSDWAGMSIYNEVTLQPKSQGGTEV